MSVKEVVGAEQGKEQSSTIGPEKAYQRPQVAVFALDAIVKGGLTTGPDDFDMQPE